MHDLWRYPSCNLPYTYPACIWKWYPIAIASAGIYTRKQNWTEPVVTTLLPDSSLKPVVTTHLPDNYLTVIPIPVITGVILST